MTIGQRIAQKRKEAGLSQESLGAELGVSRQSIYKWESDAALPEIDKLVALSRRFGVTVGWLLGVEETPEAEQPAPEKELTETQLNMVEEITNRYLAAQPQPRKRRKWPWVLAALVLICVAVNLFNRLEQLNNQYNNLQYAVSGVERSVNVQINGISDRVEEILKQQNDLTAEYRTELLNVSAADNSADFSVFAVPKTFVDGMHAEFSVDNGHGANIKLVEPVRDQNGTAIHEEFRAELSCELTDDITLSVVFVLPDGTRQTQVLDSYVGLYSDSLPNVTIYDYYLFGTELRDHTLTLKDEYVTVGSAPNEAQGSGPAADVAEIRLGVFRNQTLVEWAEPCGQPSSYHGDYTGQQFYRLPDMTLTHLSSAEKLHIAALVTDTCGRQFMTCDVPFVVSDDREDTPYLTYPADGTYDPDPANWRF